jgi:hypothetical protein
MDIVMLANTAADGKEVDLRCMLSSNTRTKGEIDSTPHVSMAVKQQKENTPNVPRKAPKVTCNKKKTHWKTKTSEPCKALALTVPAD